MQALTPFTYCYNESIKDSDYVYIVRYESSAKQDKIELDGYHINTIDIVDFSTFEEQKANGKQIELDSEPTYTYIKQYLIAKIKKADIEAIGKQFINSNKCTEMMKDLDGKRF
jgi:hypothetical protein